MLDHPAIVDHLLRRALIPATAIGESELRLTDLSRRNATCRLTGRGFPGCVVKQAGPDHVGFDRELTFYVQLERMTAGGPTIPAPRLLDADAAAGLLVVEVVDGSPWGSIPGRLGALRPVLARSLGRTLSQLHRVPPPTHLPPPEPNALRLHRPLLETVRRLSPANRQLLETLQAAPGVAAALDELRAGWRRDAFIHGDIRWDNCLVVTRTGSSPRIVLVDWECAGPGDARWDVGSAVAEYLAHWVRSLPLTGPGDLAGAIARSGVTLDRIRPSTGELWATWAGSMAGDRSGDDDLAATIRMAGARLLQLAIEEQRTVTRRTAIGVCLAQLGVNLLTADQATAATVLGGGGGPDR